ncbi:MAG TPA: glycogen debranching protein GlgX [Actinomycetota bacterium]|nr:glycogen debranching protein GlgX [Actinomycetota bacterium]
MTEIWPGSAFPLGATPSASGTGFAVASETADGVTLCLFDGQGRQTRLELPEYDAGVWHGFVPGVGPGQRYGYRASGPYDPSRGLRCNPAKLLLDPYAKAITGGVAWDDSFAGDSKQDSAPFAPRSIVVDPAFDWGDDRPPDVRFADSVIYEAHVKGTTATHPGVPPELRGTYAGLAHPAVLEHLVGLGVTAVELLPVHRSVTNGTLAARGLVNYWGYDPVGYFAPHEAYSAAVRAGRPGGQVAEFQAMVRAMHAAGLEVLLDVVFNHTGEGNERGPTLCHRGLDNPGYYRLVPGDPAHYFDTTGTGNSLNLAHSACLRMVLDSLRHWVTVMRVDGFRFDLAATLARQEDGRFDRLSAFFDVVTQDPVVSQVKLIAEPWDVGQPDSYDVGRFPPQWSEWNGRYRDTVRDFWRGQDGQLGELATRLAGSPDLYGWSRRRPSASINLITTHDGFTLRDLVSYDGKHNQANGEDNRDGSDDNRSWNCGAEGPTGDQAVLALRARQSRALLVTLLLSRGVPMLLGGDELGRTQGGNNNAYCQDNPTSWHDWSAVDAGLLDFTRRLIAFRRAHPVLRRRRFATARDLGWYTPAGTPMTDADWQAPYARSVAVHLDGMASPDLDRSGRPQLDDDLLILVNAWWEPVTFTLPEVGHAADWRLELDTYDPEATGTPAADPAPVGPRSVLVRAPH